jgi:hypothetical protein
MTEVRSENQELFSEDSPFRLALRVKNFENETQYKKFLKNCEKLVRSSLEYNLWRDYIRDVLQIQECAITQEKMSEVSIEVHHHVPSLFLMVKALVNKKIDANEEFSTFDVAIKIIELHFENKLGYITLLTSIHEKFHNGFLTIPMSIVKGDYNAFMREYGSYLDEDDLDNMNQRMSINENNCSWTRNTYSPEEQDMRTSNVNNDRQ